MAEAGAVLGGDGDEDGPIDKLNNQLDTLDEKSQTVSSAVAEQFGNFSNSLVSSFNLAESGIQGFFRKIMETIVKLTQMIVQQSIIQRMTKKKNVAASQGEAMAESISNATKSAAATGPAAVFTQPAFIATLIGGVLAAFASIPKFAKGGIVTGPTLGLVGEAGPEAIIPLNKLDGMMSGATKGEFILRGQDLVLALERADDFRTRITG